VEAMAPQVGDGDIVAILSNGGFGGIYQKLPAAIASRNTLSERA
jgi:UDP-N-acetylmuramate: L-alanyl-gamma-D-glutamyl-meso-diaminopimelate ligase